MQALGAAGGFLPRLRPTESLQKLPWVNELKSRKLLPQRCALKTGVTGKADLTEQPCWKACCCVCSSHIDRGSWPFPLSVTVTVSIQPRKGAASELGGVSNTAFINTSFSRGAETARRCGPSRPPTGLNNLARAMAVFTHSWVLNHGLEEVRLRRAGTRGAPAHSPPRAPPRAFFSLHPERTFLRAVGSPRRGQARARLISLS